MRLPLTIAEQDVALSERSREIIRRKVGKLERFYRRIMGCRVSVEQEGAGHRNGKPYRVQVDLTVPGGELVVNRHSSVNLHVALREAFDAIVRQLEGYAQRQRGDVKRHASMALPL